MRASVALRGAAGVLYMMASVSALFCVLLKAVGTRRCYLYRVCVELCCRSALYEGFCRLMCSERDEVEKADTYMCVLRLMITEFHFAGVSRIPICLFVCF